MIILFTRHNEAGANIAKKLVAEHGFKPRGHAPGGAATGEWERDGVRMIDSAAPTVLDVPTDFDTDCLVVLSTHRSKTPGRMLTAHVPGNWGDAGMGGEPRTLNIAHAAMLKRLIRGLDAANRRRGLDWPVCLEADHHGPTCGVPILFVEIGNDEEQWQDERAAQVVADAVAEAVFGKDDGGPGIVAFGVGGGHYQRAFTRLVIDTDMAIGHMAPKYAIDGMDEGLFRQALERNVGKAAKVLILKDEVSAVQREKVRDFAHSAGIPAELL
jgi:D-aminoacyl-tRNA deacylase